MNTRNILASSLVVAGVIAVVGWLRFKQPASMNTARTRPEPVVLPEPPKHPLPALTPPAAPGRAATETISSGSESAPPPVKDVAPQQAATPSARAKKPKAPLHDPAARLALSLVGDDPNAEAYWLEAIYDTSLPDEEREDLMEDLNEDGLSDQRRPGPQDFPLIINRLAIIEVVAPFADEFMLPHLAEAYKDLLNLADITQGGGTPVR